jgi:hypothetical protein
MLDRQERSVYVNPEIQHEGRRRFRSLHEVGHDILPSQQRPAYADNARSLSWVTHLKDEQDANQTAAELMFQRDLFRRMASEYQVGMAAVVELADRFGASYQASLRRYAETHRAAVAGIVLDHSPCAADPLGFRRREAICSVAWEGQFGRPDGWPTVLTSPVFSFVQEARRAALWQATADGEFRFPALDGEPWDLHVSAFSNTYSVLVLLWNPPRQRLKRRRRLVVTSA